MSVFITGTDTNVGKTVVTAGIAAVMQGLGYSIGVYKPVQTGAIEAGDNLISPDLHFVHSIDPNILVKSTYDFINPVAPSLAAAVENVKINPNYFLRDYQELKNECDLVLVEGAGGILAPVYENFLIRDLIKLLNLPLLIVARPDLGTINHTLLAIEAARSYNIDILGIIISNYPANTDDIAIKAAPDMIKSLSGVDILGVLPKVEGLMHDFNNHELLIEYVINNLDLQQIFRIKIPKLLQNV
ncbi:MAG: dethiobiotin synthase [Candidatus Melainabacteria bacterium GWF2_32_7]|nr:MAG: dethiobiotin synthase [Candidatus Melainabacteria bacterium GWF2_32_7]